MEYRNLPSESFNCCCGQSECASDRQHQVIVKGLKKDLRLAAQTGLQMMKRSQENEREMKAEIDQLNAENERLIDLNSQLLTESATRTKQQADATQRVSELESALKTAQSRANQLRTYYALANSLEEQVAALETLRAELEQERDAARADSDAFERKWRSSERLAAQVQASYQVLESALAQRTIAKLNPAPTATSTAPHTPNEPKRMPRHGFITPDPTPDVSFADDSVISLAAELEAFERKPRLKRACSHESIFTPPCLAVPAFAPTFKERSSLTTAPEMVVASGVRTGPGRGSARAFLGNVGVKR